MQPRAKASPLPKPGSQAFGPRTKRDFALEMLRASIIEAEFRPGQRLYIDQLAERLQMSETPIREALRQLAAEGLVSFLPHRGVLVAETSSEEIRTIFLMRQGLEGLAVRLAMRNLTDRDLKRLEQVHKRLVTAARANDPPGVRRANREFHVQLYQLARSEQLYEFLRILWAKLPADLLLVAPNLMEVTVADHARLLAALAARDVVEAERLMVEHIGNALEAVMQGSGVAAPS